jgi:hypothetical protein
MMRRLSLLAILMLAQAASAQTDADGYRPLFNGKDLSGWVPVNVHPNTFQVKDGMIYTTGQPIGYMRTDKQYENFICEFDWMHVNKKEVGNSGFFVWADTVPTMGTPFTRGIEVQVLVNLEYKDKKGNVTASSHGDVFAIHGATCVPDRPHPAGAMRCIPSEYRAKGGGEWNHYKVIANDGVIKLEVNGKEVSGVSKCNPRKGWLALESEGAECYFKNIKIKELPSTNPKPEEIAKAEPDFKSMFTGLDLAGWKVEEGHKGHWNVKGGKIDYDGKAEGKDKNLWTEKEYGDFEMIVDWKLTGPKKKMMRQVIEPNGDEPKDKMEEVLDAGDSGIYLRGTSKAQINIWCWPIGSGEVWGYRKDKNQPPEVRAGVTPKVRADNPPGQWNRFHITMKGDRLTVVLNGKTVIENAQLPGVPAKGPIALQHHGDTVQFGNLFIRELK